MTSKIDWNGVREARRSLEAIAREHPEMLAPPSDRNRRGWETDLEDIIMARPPALGKTTQVAFRLPDELIERIDRHVEQMRRQAPGITITRADGVRSLLSAALGQVEAPKAKAKGKAKGKR